MNFLNIKRFYAHAILLVILMLPYHLSSAALAEMVWIESDDHVNSIQFAFYYDDEWVTHEKALYLSERSLTSLALGTDKHGAKTLIWTEQVRSKTVLMSMTAQVDRTNSLNWSQPQLFSDDGRENFSASIVYDQNGGGWVFWAETKSNYSDIVYRRANGIIWGPTQPVHRRNQVPDNLPRASINENGSVRVEWNSFDLNSGSYQFKSREYPTSIESSHERPNMVDVVSELDISLPPKLHAGNTALLHFPNNQIQQTVRLGDSQ